MDTPEEESENPSSEDDGGGDLSVQRTVTAEVSVTEPDDTDG